jgi:hypothetical protein
MKKLFTKFVNWWLGSKYPFHEYTYKLIFPNKRSKKFKVIVDNRGECVGKDIINYVFEFTNKDLIKQNSQLRKEGYKLIYIDYKELP